MIGKSTVDSILREEMPLAVSISDLTIGKLPWSSNLVVFSLMKNYRVATLMPKEWMFPIRVEPRVNLSSLRNVEMSGFSIFLNI